jgi:hypothetical protein
LSWGVVWLVQTSSESRSLTAVTTFGSSLTKRRLWLRIPIFIQFSIVFWCESDPLLLKQIVKGMNEFERIPKMIIQRNWVCLFLPYVFVWLWLNRKSCFLPSSRLIESQHRMTIAQHPPWKVFRKWEVI